VKAPKGKRIGGGTVGKLIAVGVAAYVYFDTGDAFAAAQTANPIANTVEVSMTANPNVKDQAKAIVTDVYNVTPIATGEWVWDNVKPHGLFVYDPVLAHKALQQGRNAFCSQCHGAGGALDPNNEWNQAARAGDVAAMKAYQARLEVVDLDKLWNN
jgi:hypothetical protein